MPKRVAVVISGAVSLGSYEAGVTYELLEAIARHNEDPATLPEDRLIIDVITGASAGGITATILAKCLLCHGKILRKPYDNPLYKAWVEEVRMLGENGGELGLLEVPADQHKYSILNVNTLNNIAKKILPDVLNSSSTDLPVEDPHLAAQTESSSNSQILVGLAMGNLNGFPLSIPLNQGTSTKNDASESDAFTYSQYKDRFVVRMSRNGKGEETSVNLEEWEEYKSTPQERKRWRCRKNTPENPNMVTWSMLREITLSSGAFPFAFGVRQIERYSDSDALYASRSTTRKRQAFKSGFNTPANCEDPFNGRYIYTDGGVFENEPIGLAIRLVESLCGEGEIASRDRLFIFIAPGSRKANSDPFRSIASTTDDTARPDHIAVAKALMAAIMGQSRFQQWIIDDRTPQVLAVTSKDSELLGDVFSAFAGFLDERFRAYDYNVGRQSAQSELIRIFNNNLANGHATSPFPLNGSPSELSPPIWPPTRRISEIQIPHQASPTNWKDAQAYFGPLAQGSRAGQTRNEVEELKALLGIIDEESKKKIKYQLLARVESLVGYLSVSVRGKTQDNSLKGILDSLLFRLGLLWVLISGRRTVEIMAKGLASKWLEKNLGL